MILKTKYFDLETDSLSFKEPESIRDRLDRKFKNCFTDKPTTNLVYECNPFKISLKYEPTPNYFYAPFPIYQDDLIFQDVGHIEGYKTMDDDYTCRKFHYEPNQSYSIDEDPIPCEKGFHFCRELADCFNYYRPTEYIDQTSTITYDLDVFKFFNVKSNGVTYQLWDKCCTNNITILDECSTEEILEAFNKWLDATYDCKVILRGKSYLLHDGIYHIPDEELDKQLTWYTYLKED